MKVDSRSHARLATSIAFFLDGLTFATWVSRIPDVKDRLNLSDLRLGTALLMLSLGALVTMPIKGKIVAKLGSRAGVVLALCLFGFGLILPAFATDFSTLAISLLIFGAGFGATNVASNAQAVTVERAFDRPIMSSFHALFSGGGIAGAVIGSVAVAHHVPMKSQCIAIACITILSALAMSSRFMKDAEIPEESIDRSRGVYLRFLVLGAIAFCIMFGEGSMADWTGVFLEKVSGTSKWVAAIGFGAFSATMTIGRIVGDRLTTKFGQVGMLRVGGSLAAAGVLLAIASPAAITAIAGFAMVGAGLSALVPTVFSAAGRTRGVSPSVAIAAVSTIGYFGFLSGPPLIGWASDLFSLRRAMILVLIASGSVVILSRRAGSRSDG